MDPLEVPDHRLPSLLRGPASHPVLSPAACRITVRSPGDDLVDDAPGPIPWNMRGVDRISDHESKLSIGLSFTKTQSGGQEVDPSALIWRQSRVMRAAAMRADSTGSGPVVVRPSVRRMMTEASWDPGGTGWNGGRLGSPPEASGAPRCRASGRGSDERRCERDHPDPGAAWLLGDEGPRRGLGGDQPVREDVGGPHAAGDVHREDDRVVVGGQGDDGARPRHREEHCDERQQEQERRQVAPPALTRAEGLPHEVEARVAQSPEDAQAPGVARAARCRP
jgi:hypothetical protein